MTIRPLPARSTRWLPARPWIVTTIHRGTHTTHSLLATTAAHAIASALELGGRGCGLVQCLRDGEWA